MLSAQTYTYIYKHIHLNNDVMINNDMLWKELMRNNHTFFPDVIFWALKEQNDEENDNAMKKEQRYCSIIHEFCLSYMIVCRLLIRKFICILLSSGWIQFKLFLQNRERKEIDAFRSLFNNSHCLIMYF